MDTDKKARIATAVMAAALLAGGVVLGAAPAQATYAPVKAFKNCTAMHKVSAYRGGIKRVGAHDRRSSGGAAQYKPYVSSKRYKLNAGSDRDHDGVSCEQ